MSDQGRACCNRRNLLQLLSLTPFVKRLLGLIRRNIDLNKIALKRLQKLGLELLFDEVVNTELVELMLLDFLHPFSVLLEKLIGIRE